MFKSFVIGKKGYGNIEFRHHDDGRYTVFMNHCEIPMTRDHMVAFKEAYIAEGWEIKTTAKTTETPKIVNEPIKAPKEPERLSKEESLTKKYGDKESRRLYKRTEAYYTSVARRATDPKLPIKEFRDRVAILVEEAMKTWESNGRPDVITKLGR